ncbi:MAG TPA: hypothetical protein VMR46_02715 [Candidatus Paceibacterota bacterium]|nr:hypothetical protein [Candidatus Paceibacterota bacterium]
MTLKQFIFRAALLLGLITLTPALVLAQTSVTTGVNASASVTGTSATVSASTKITATLAKAKTRGDTEIDRRTAALTDLNTRVQAMQKVTDAFKQSLSTTVTSEISALATLKAKIDADTDAATLKTDLQSITTSYRVFALVLPQGRIAAAADREVTLVSMMSTLGAKLQARVQTAGQGGADVTALTAALTDMASKLQDAQTQAEAAVSTSAALTPDNGNATQMASNTAALKAARGDIKTAQADLVAARKDITTVTAGLKAVAPASAAASTTAQ